MTDLPKTTSAIRVLREHPRFWDCRYALASALEELAGASPHQRESLNPPTPTESGEAPEPLPEALPVGTLSTTGARAITELRLETRRTRAGEGRGYWGRWSSFPDEDLYNTPDNIDWKEWRRTHSPPPSREGEAPPLTFERAYLHEKKRAEAAEERAANDRADYDRERQKLFAQACGFEKERDEARARVAELESELEAARALVGELEDACRLMALPSEERYQYLEQLARIALDADRLDKAYQCSTGNCQNYGCVIAAGMVVCGICRIGMDTDAKPTPTASPVDGGAETEAVARETLDEAARNEQLSRELQAVADETVEALFGGEKESPPRDSGGENAEPKGTECTPNPCPTAPETSATRNQPTPSAGSVAAAPSSTKTGIARAEATRTTSTDAQPVSTPGGSTAPIREVAPPGLTPEEAGTSLSRSLTPDHMGLTGELYDELQMAERRFHKFDQWPLLDDDWREFLMRFRQRVHSEGAKAAKAKGGKVAERVRAATRKAQFVAMQLGGVFGYDDAEALAKELEALAAELEER